MKKILILLFTLCFSYSTEWNSLGSDNPTPYNKEILTSTDSEIVVKFNLEGYSTDLVETPIGDAFRIGTMLGASILENGAPDLQKLSASLKIPNDKHMNSNVESFEYFEIENILIAPSKGNLPRTINPSNVEYSWSDVYETNSFYPGKLTDLNTPYIIRDFRGQAVNVYPFQYNPITETLRIYTEIIISVKPDGPGEINVIENDNSDTIDYDFVKIYDRHFENFDIIDTDTRFEFVAEQGNMLIISYGDFIDEMEPFVNWKNRKGIYTEIIDVADIGGNSSAIESFVDDYYHTNGLTFLLLVGDANQVPTPSISGSASDPSYGFIDGNDSYAELFVGRFSANSPSELITQIDRSLDYEQNSPFDPWYNNALSVGSNQGPGWGGLTDDQFLETAIAPMLLDYTYSNHTGIYDPNQSIQDGIDAINNGVSIINYTGHGWQQGWGNGSPLEISHVNNLENAGKLPFVITVGCNVGEFNTVTNSYSESWLRATNNGEAVGGIGHLGSTISQSWEPPMHGQYGMNLILTESYDGGVSHTAGGVVTNGCMYMNDMQGSSGINETNYWTLFGDPSIHLRTDEPTSLNTSYSSSIVIGASSLDISYTGSEVLAALSNDNELLAYAYGNNGTLSIDFSNIDLQPGEYDLVITGYNAFTEQTTINVIAPEGAYLIYDSYQIVEDSGLNDFVEFGDDISVDLIIENVGVENTNAVNVNVTTADEYVTLTNGTSQIAYAISSQTATTETPISFSIAESIPDGHMIQFSAQFYNDQGNWEDNFTIEAHAPIFSASNPQVIDENGDGIWDAGESATILVNCANIGSADFNWYPGATISTTSPYIQILSDENINTWYGIGAGMSYVAEFLVVANPIAPNGTTASFTVNWGYSNTAPCEGDCVQNDQFTFSSTIGIPLNEDAAFPENVIAFENENGVMIEWDEPNLYDCNADAPYNDNCYGYVIQIDPYCCDTNWDSICEGEYCECNGGIWDWYTNDCSINDGGDDCVCSGEWDPVCGVDGNTYSNPCFAECENVEIDYPGECITDPNNCAEGYVEDCSGDGDCCAEAWIGDGVPDCEDQLYGCDLTCYDNDGGDCSNEFTSSDQHLSYEQRLHRAENSPILLNSNQQQLREDVVGYNVFKDGEYIAYVTDTSHLDEDVIGGETYCYTISALYENYQSYQSDNVCITTEGTLFEMGDVNMDDNINVLDIIVIINMILDITPTDLELGDLNNDNSLNVLDIILIVNIILDSRSTDASEFQLIKTNNGLSFNTNGFIGAIELKIKHSNSAQLTITNDALVSNSITNEHISHIIIVAPESNNIFNIDSDYEILDIIVANSSSKIEVEYANIFNLSPAYPNPFNPSTQFDFTLPNNEMVKISIYNMIGQEVEIIHNDMLSSGIHTFNWNANNMPSGIYFIALQSDSYKINQKIVLLK